MLLKQRLCFQLVSFILVSFVSVGTAQAKTQALDLKVTTFNIKWYGSPGEEEWRRQRNDARDVSLVDFMSQTIADSHVIFFQEIVDTNRLATLMTRFQMHCYTYEFKGPKHQALVTCIKDNFRMILASDDHNYELENTATGRLRPTLHGVLTDARTGKKLVHLFNLHLKASPYHSHIRVKQTEALAQYINSRREQLPAIIAGDFNSFAQSSIDSRYSDAQLISQILTQTSIGMAMIENPWPYTYNNQKYVNKFDHIFASKGTQQLTQVGVYGACNSQDTTPNSYNNIVYFNENVSDHCPTSVLLRVFH